jgi:predicted dehydrogenase
MIHVGVIGCGQWGPNHVRNFSHLSGSRALMCADLSEKRLRVMKETFRNIRPTRDHREILNHPKIDAVVIATPTATHYRLVKESLLAGKDVLCEKPLCLKVDEARELVRLAKRRKRILMVGHVFLFNPGIRKLKQLVAKGQCGRIYYIHSERTNLGPFRTDVNSVWDLAAHDVSIFNYLLSAMPREVSARGGRYLQKHLEDVAFISLVYPMGILVNIHVSWLDPRKVRQITVVGDKKMVIWDDLDHMGPIKIYNRQVEQHNFYETFGEFYLLAKEGSITIPRVESYEPLKTQDAHFLECVAKRKKPLTDGASALDAVRILCAIEASLARKGVPVPVR